MKKIFHIVILVQAFLFPAINSHAQNVEPDAVYRNISKEFVLKTDGSVVYHYSHELKLLSYFSFSRQYGETSVIYDPRYQKIKVNYAYTIMADGKKVPCPTNAFNEVLPDFCANAPAYNYLRRYVIVHTGLERNAVIHVDYEVITEKGYYPALMGNEVLATLSPVEKEQINVKIPKDGQLKYKTLNSAVNPVMSTNGDTSVYSWNFENIPAMIPEQQLPPVSAFAPYLLFSSASDLNIVYKVFLNQDAFKNFADEKMTAWANELKKTCSSELEFVLKLQEEVAVNMKTYNVPLPYSGYKINTPVDVFHANGGTPLEKAGLMCALLSYFNIKAYPVLAAYENLVDPEIGNLNVFNEVFVRVYTDPAKTLYFPVDRTVRQTQQYNMNGKKLLPLLTDLKILNIVTENNSDNDLIFDGTFKVDKEGKISGNGLVFLSGITNPAFSFDNDTLKTINEILTGIVPVKDKEPKIFAISQYRSTFIQEYSLSTSSISSQNEYIFIDLPFFNDGFESWHIQYLNTLRNQPFYLPFALREEYTYIIKLPKNIQVASQNYKITKENEIGEVSLILNVAKREVKIYREIVLNKQVIKAEEYEKLKDLIIPWLDKNYRMLVLKKMD